MRARKLMAGCFVLLMMFVASSIVEAQCPTGARQFASIGGMGTERMRVQTRSAFNQGQEIARFWDPSDSSRGNNFDGQCPSNDATQAFGEWWSDQSSVAPGLRGIRGAISATNCGASSCPSDDLVVLVEDWGASGPPGISDTAYFIAFRAPLDAPGAGSSRRWDLALTDNPVNGAASPTTVEMIEFPTPLVVAASNQPYGLVLSLEYEDIAGGVFAVDAEGNALPASSVVLSYDLYLVGTMGQDPGRLAADWTLLQSTPYSDNPASTEVTTNCLLIGQADCYLAAGLTFEGGDGTPVRSALVGRAIRLETSFYPPNPAGRAPDGKDVQGEPLRIARPDGSTLALTWGDSCGGQDWNFAVYSGQLGDFYSHEPLTCAAGSGPYEPPDEAGSRYYFVVPISAPGQFGEQPSEGSYGRASDGSERPQDPFTACLSKVFLPCH